MVTQRAAPGHGFERGLAFVVFVLPLWYLLSERSRQVDIWRWSWAWFAAIAAYAVAFITLLRSYRTAKARAFETLRSLLVVVSSATLLALVVAEVALLARQPGTAVEADNRGRHAPDPDVGHVYLPNHSQTLREREFQTEWRSNAQALRAEHDYGPKASGTKRILVVGDSFTVGDQVAYADTYPAVIERELERLSAAAPIEVLNAGHPGFATVNEARWIAKFGAALEPDLIVLCMTPNDLLENQFPLKYTARDGALVLSVSTDADRARWADARQWWSLSGIVRRSLLRERVLGAAWVKRLRTGSAFTHRFAFMQEPNARSKELFALAEKYLLEARGNAIEIGARFAVIVLPFREQLRELEPGLAGDAFPKHWSSFCAAQQVPMFDLLPAFRAVADPTTLYWRIDSHCTAAGYRVIGEATAQWITSRATELGL